MAVYDIPGVGPVDLGDFDPASLGIGDIGAAAMPAGTTGQSLSSALEVLDAMKRGRYDRPVADMDVEQLSELSGLSGLQFVTNKGKAASTKANRSGFIPLVEDAEYRIVNERGKNQVAYSGIGQEGLMGVYNTAQNLSATGGTKADWYVEAKDPSTGTWVKVADDDPPSDIVGDVLQYAAMAGIGALTGGVAGIGALAGAGLGAATKAVGIDDEIMKYVLPVALSLTPLGPVAGAALGSAIGTAYNGGNLKQILLSAGISAATAGVLDATGIGDQIGSLISKVPGANSVVDGLSKVANGVAEKVTGDALARGVGEVAAQEIGRKAAEEIIVNGFTGMANAVAGVGGAVGSGAIDLITNAANQAVENTIKQQTQQQFDQVFPQGGTQAGIGGQAPITVYASNPRVDAAVKAMLASGGGSVYDAAFRGLTDAEFQEAKNKYYEIKGIEAVGQSTTGATTGGVAGATAGLGEVQPDGTIKVTGREQPEIPVAPPVPVDTGADTGKDGGEKDSTDTGEDKDGGGPGVKDWVRLGLLGLNAIGGAAGGGGGATPRDTTPLTYTPISRTPTISQGIGEPPFDVFTYGQGIPGAQQSEFSFFEPFSWKQPGGTAPVNVATGLPQSQVDAQAAADQAQAQAAYDANAAKFNAYQNDLAAKVRAGTLTPEQATAEATTYAGTLGLPLAPVPTTTGTPMKEGGEVDDEIMEHLLAYKRMGGHQGPGPVKGIGSGQDDKIPAWLSDGEYVWSAQDVADLGDGSTDEGVRRLDKMRQMVRRRAGRKDVKKIAKPQRGIDTMLKAVGGVA